MNQTSNFIAGLEFATLYSAACFFIWILESWKSVATGVLLAFTTILWKITVNEFSFHNFSVGEMDTWTPLTWGSLGFFSGAVSGAILRVFKRPST